MRQSNRRFYERIMVKTIVELETRKHNIPIITKKKRIKAEHSHQWREVLGLYTKKRYTHIPYRANLLYKEKRGSRWESRWSWHFVGRKRESKTREWELREQKEEEIKGKEREVNEEKEVRIVNGRRKKLGAHIPFLVIYNN